MRDFSLTNYFHDFNQILIWQGFDGIIFALLLVLTPVFRVRQGRSRRNMKNTCPTKIKTTTMFKKTVGNGT